MSERESRGKARFSIRVVGGGPRNERLTASHGGVTALTTSSS